MIHYQDLPFMGDGAILKDRDGIPTEMTDKEVVEFINTIWNELKTARGFESPTPDQAAYEAYRARVADDVGRG